MGRLHTLHTTLERLDADIQTHTAYCQGVQHRLSEGIEALEEALYALGTAADPSGEQAARRRPLNRMSCVASASVSAHQLIAYATLLGKTTFAPPHMDMQHILRQYRPPIPQEDMMRCSALYRDAATLATASDARSGSTQHREAPPGELSTRTHGHACQPPALHIDNDAPATPAAAAPVVTPLQPLFASVIQMTLTQDWLDFDL